MCDCEDCEEKRILKRMKQRDSECKKYRKCECKKCECKKNECKKYEYNKCIEKYNKCYEEECHEQHHENKIGKCRENSNEKIIIISIN